MRLIERYKKKKSLFIIEKDGEKKQKYCEI